MARSRKPHIEDVELTTPENPDGGGGGAGAVGGETTGRFIVVFKEGDAATTRKVKSVLSNFAGIKNVGVAADYAESAVSGADLASTAGLYFETLGIAVVSGEDEAIQALVTQAADADSAMMLIEPEYRAYAYSSLGGLTADYLRGYRDAVNHLTDQLIQTPREQETIEAAAARFADTAQFTWGLQATRVSTSRYSGQGVKVAVLDTGIDLQHPDFQGRAIFTNSFVSGQSVQDGNRHGTHCIGTACGGKQPVGVRRYGIAYGSTIYAGKVLSNQGSGATGGIVAGIEWAIVNGCKVVSMSLGANIDQKIQQYEVPIRRALNAGTVVIAAAGNNAARRLGNFGFVTPPANADAAQAVAAIDSQLAVADFSARSSTNTGDGGKVNIAGPGVNVFSSVPVALGTHGVLSGTSMATPHVAGIAALWCQATGATGAALLSRLEQSARPLMLPTVDVGFGLVQAPQ
jgi:subtilisin family serine protease